MEIFEIRQQFWQNDVFKTSVIANVVEALTIRRKQ